MKRFLKKRKMRGFTLVELLIVIIIIGILAGALLLVAGAGTDKANATKVVSDMRSLKAATIMIYADYSNWPDDLTTSVDDYMDRDLSTNVATYSILSNDSGLYIQAEVADPKVEEKLDLMDDSGVTDSGDYYILKVK